MEQTIENDNSTNVDGVEETQTEEQETSLEPEQAQADPEKEELKKKNAQLYARLKKLEEKSAPQQTKKESVPTDTVLSTSDVLTLVAAGITNEDDINTLTESAKALRLPIKEAIKNSTIKSLLTIRQEERRTAEATSTQVSRRGATKVSDEKLLSDAKKGIMPDNDEDLQRLIAARKKAS